MKEIEAINLRESKVGCTGRAGGREKRKEESDVITF